MRRLGSLALVAVAVLVALMLGGATEEEGARTYRVDAVFLNASHLIPGQLVKIAGAEVGTVKDVKLTRDRKARVMMEIDERFAPFHADARCTIRPQSLIGEKFVQCTPGTPKAPALEGKGDEAPTVPVDQNATPVDLDLVFNALRLPYRQRLALIINELGVGLAGRPEELNEAIRRANPALEETNRVLEIVDNDRATLARLIESSDTVIGELADKRRDVQEFVDRAGAVADEVASKKGDVDLAIRRLPPLLDQLEPTATDLATLTGEARPILANLRAASPGIRALAADLDPLTKAARPALISLADMSVTGRSAVRAATPIAALLRPVAAKLPGVTGPTLDLLVDMKKRGVVEGLQDFAYYATLATSRFDRYSHILPSYQLAGLCSIHAEGEPTAGCDAHFAGSSENGRADRSASSDDDKKKKKRKRRRGSDRDDDRNQAGQDQAAPSVPSAPTAPAPSAPSTPQLPVPVPAVPELPIPQPQQNGPSQNAVEDLLDFLLGS